MAKELIQIQVRMDEKTFRNFALFDTFRRQKRWKKPVIFAAIMLAFSAICFALNAREGAVMLGTLLLILGVGMPAVYVSMFLTSISASVKAQKLPRAVYALRLTTAADGVEIRSLSNQKEQMTLKWEQLHAAYRVNGCIYLYAVPQKAFLLPDGQADCSPDALWSFLQKRMPKGRAADMRKK